MNLRVYPETLRHFEKLRTPWQILCSLSWSEPSVLLFHSRIACAVSGHQNQGCMQIAKKHLENSVYSLVFSET
jgi:hypothetical protein